MFNSIGDSCFAATRTWLGTFNNDLTEPRNWNGGTLPVDGDSWYFGTSPNHQLTQYDYDLLPYVATLQLTDSPDGPYSFIGEGLLNVGTVNVSGSGHWIAGFRRPDAVTIVTNANGTADANLAIGYIHMPGDFTILGSGTVSLFQSDYNGQTTIGDGATLSAGGKFFNDIGAAGLTVYGDVVLEGHHSMLTGLGGISLRDGHTLRVNSGIISPGIVGVVDQEEATLRIYGDAVFGDDSTLQVQFIDLSHAAELSVKGLLDLRGVGDTLSVPSSFSGSVVVADYQQRVGQFDFVDGVPGLTVTYTSAEGAGPGQVIIQLPEPCGLGLIFATVSLSCARRRSTV
jgi:hypothetical protein